MSLVCSQSCSVHSGDLLSDNTLSASHLPITLGDPLPPQHMPRSGTKKNIFFLRLSSSAVPSSAQMHCVVHVCLRVGVRREYLGLPV